MAQKYSEDVMDTQKNFSSYFVVPKPPSTMDEYEEKPPGNVRKQFGSSTVLKTGVIGPGYKNRRVRKIVGGPGGVSTTRAQAQKLDAEVKKIKIKKENKANRQAGSGQGFSLTSKPTKVLPSTATNPKAGIPQPPAVPKPTSGGPGGGGSGGGQPGGGLSGGGQQPVLGDLANMIINPKQYAKSVTDLAYASLINEIKRQQDYQKSQAMAQEANINKWFNIVDTQQAEGARANTEIGARIRRELADMTAGSASLLEGTDAGGLASSYGDLLEGTNAEIQGAQERFDNSMNTIIEAERADQLSSNQNTQALLAADLAANLLDAESEKGSAYVKNLFDAQQLKLQQMAAVQNMQLGQQYLVDIGGGQQVPIEVAGQLQGLQRGNLDMKYTQAQINALNRQSDEDEDQVIGGVVPFDETANAIESIQARWYRDPVSGQPYTTQQGQPKLLHPLKVWSDAGNYLSGLYGPKGRPKNNAEVAKWLSNIWLPYVERYQAAYPQKNFPGKAFTDAQATKFLTKIGAY